VIEKAHQSTIVPLGYQSVPVPSGDERG
jgi:hypothetical protein